MATQTNTTQVFPQNQPIFIDVRTKGSLVKYRAWVGPHIVRGLTKGPVEKAKEVVARIARATEDVPDVVRELVHNVTDYIVENSHLTEVAVMLSTFFLFGEYIAIRVRLQRLNGPISNGRVWLHVTVLFKGDDGLKALSRHVVERFFELYAPNQVDRDQVYNVIYTAARIAFNAYKGAGKH
jgi:hypothetical protein